MLNLNRFQFYTVQEYSMRRKDREWTPTALIFLIILWAASMFSLGVFGFDLYRWVYPLTITSSTYGIDHIFPKSLVEWDGPLSEAVREWEKETKWTFSKPTLVIDTDAKCIEEIVIACADESKWTIYLSKDAKIWDRKTVMMHEMAHLLGVPHIYGDILMSPTYMGKLDRPTDEAVALAMVYLKRDELNKDKRKRSY